MLKICWQSFVRLNFWVKIIWIFCLLGAFCNAIAICRDLQGNSILLRLHIGFFVMYAGQVACILMHERMIVVVSLMQAIFALVTNLDFTFVPVVRLIGKLFYVLHGELSVDDLPVYKYVFVSLCFTLELLKSYFLFFLIAPHSAPEEEAASSPTQAM